jgi:hypothetical protein
MLVETYHLKEKVERLVSYLPLSHVAANILDIFVLVKLLTVTVLKLVYFINLYYFYSQLKNDPFWLRFKIFR